MSVGERAYAFEFMYRDNEEDASAASKVCQVFCTEEFYFETSSHQSLLVNALYQTTTESLERLIKTNNETQ